MRDGEAEDALGDVSLKLARHNLEVSLKRTKEEGFRVAKKIALEEGVEGARKMDAFARAQYADEAREMAGWEEIMLRCAFVDEEDGGEGRRGG